MLRWTGTKFQILGRLSDVMLKQMDETTDCSVFNFDHNYPYPIFQAHKTILASTIKPT